jgi:hypothetical protein
MERDIECRIGLPRRGKHKIDGCVEPAEVDPEMAKLAVQSQFQHPVRANTHGIGA